LTPNLNFSQNCVGEYPAIPHLPISTSLPFQPGIISLALNSFQFTQTLRKHQMICLERRTEDEVFLSLLSRMEMNEKSKAAGGSKHHHWVSAWITTTKHFTENL